MSGGSDAIILAFDKPKKHERKAKSGGGPPPTEPPGRHIPPPLLPPESPVQALGVNGREFYFLNCRGQFMALTDKDIGRLAIIGMFGGVEYLRTQWPRYDRSGKSVINFDHGGIGEVLIKSCSVKGIWSPEESVRGVGCWAEERDDGSTILVMHCGDRLFLSNAMPPDEPGLRGRLLYPAAPAQPHPEKGGAPGPRLLDKLRSWNWQRGEIDAQLHLGWMMSALLGAAPDWRPIEWVTGDSGTGKSKLMKLTRWVLGDHAMIKSEDATAAGIKRKVANSALPVSLDEQESDGQQGNRKVSELIKLARIASSGGESVRGTPGTDAISFVSRNCFQFSSIVIPSLPQQDKNRMFIGVLEQMREARESAFAKKNDEDDDASQDEVLGDRDEWRRDGCRLRQRALDQWGRYRKTWKAYRRALLAQGHSDRGADQFGALGAAYDLAMHDTFVVQRADDWAAELPAAQLAETSGYAKNHEACLMHLLGAPVEVYRGGAKETVAQLLQTAREDIHSSTANASSADDALQGIGIKVYRDPRDAAAWWVVVANSHSALLRMFRDTDWSGLPGAPGAWSQMMERIAGAVTKNPAGNRLRLKFQKVPLYCVALPWEAVFPDPRADDDDQFREP